VAAVFRETHGIVAGAVKEFAEELIEMSKEKARKFGQSPYIILVSKKCTYYWFDVVPLEGMFIVRGTAPPSSRKFTATPDDPPRLLDFSDPSK